MVVFKALFSKIVHSEISPRCDSRSLATLELIMFKCGVLHVNNS